MHRASDLIAALAGSWSVERRLLDLRSGHEGQFSGIACFEPAGGRLGWTERGRVRFGGHEGEAWRRLAIVRGAHGWTVEFEDGRPFHALDLATGACAVEHRCGSDLYTGEYRLLDPGALDVDWWVEGPHKRQEIRSTYRRDGSGGRLS